MVYIYERGKKIAVPTLTPYLRASTGTNILMDSAVMLENDKKTCRWIGFGIGKGVTDPARNISVFATPGKACRGLHAELVRGFDNVDPYPLCYDELNHDKGFGGFVRWVYFNDPKDNDDVLGIDFSITARPTAGIANSVIGAARIVKALIHHGLPEDIEVALLNCRMCEEPAIYKMRHAAGLARAKNWIILAARLFDPRGNFCSRCGLETRRIKTGYCYKCGGKPQLY